MLTLFIVFFDPLSDESLFFLSFELKVSGQINMYHTYPLTVTLRKPQKNNKTSVPAVIF